MSDSLDTINNHVTNKYSSFKFFVAQASNRSNRKSRVIAVFIFLLMLAFHALAVLNTNI